jgi:uncharacterized protein YbaR (Trm112 family)
MHPDFATRLVCPACHSWPLKLGEETTTVGEEVATGVLVCNRCSSVYRIRHGVPFLLTPDQLARVHEGVGAGEEAELADYHTEATPAVARLLRRLAEGSSVILDIGSGRSPYRHLFEGELICVDLFPQFLYDLQRHVRPRLRIHAVCASASNLPFRPGVADIAFASEVIEHLPPHEAREALDAWPRFARNFCVIDTPNGNESSLITRLRHRLYRTKTLTEVEHPALPELDHHSTFVPNDFRRAGYECHGCIGWVSRKRFRVGPLWDLYDAIAWRFPSIGGTLIAVAPGGGERASIDADS